MAATLPPINKSNNEGIPSYGKPRPPPGGKLDPLIAKSDGCMGKRDRNLAEKNAALRSQLPTLLKRDISK